jgi:pimeloyl-ACP methyl ester carboxylesterase
VPNLVAPEATLALEGDGHQVDPSVKADGLVRAPVHFPGLAAVDGMRRLLRFVRQRLASGEMLIFAYDWRLSCRVNGRLLAELVEIWRRWSRDRDAKVILVCHSMGGLVARAFLDLEGGAEQCRRLITLGAPFQGSVNALGCLVNGAYPWSDRISEGLIKLAGTWPSVYELLPVYPAIVRRGGALAPLSGIDVPGLDRERVQQAQAFHDELHKAVKARNGAPPPYEVTAIIGHLQPTFQFVRVKAGGVQLLTEYHSVDLGGDGTVPCQSACPPEWDDDSRAKFFAHTHLSLPNSKRMLDHLHAVMTAVPRPPMTVRAGLSIDAPEVVGEGEPFEVAADVTDPRLALLATVMTAGGKTLASRPVEHRNDRQVAVFDGLPPGAYQVTVSTAAPNVRDVESVTDVLTVWPTAATRT